MADGVRYPREILINFIVEYLTTKGVTEANSQTVADVVVRTEAAGIHTHGLAMLQYFDRNLPQNIDATAEPLIVKRGASTAMIEGNDGFAQLAMNAATNMAEESVSRTGTATVSVRNCAWLGAAGPYLIPLVERGYLAQLVCQTSNSPDSAPWGGIDGRFSTNPIAMSFPTDGDPVLVDFSTTAISMGKTKRMAQTGESPSEPLYLDNEGNLTTDPSAALTGGTILPLGGANYGFRGYGLALWTEALTALSGGMCNNLESKLRQSVVLFVMAPEAFAGEEYYYREIERFKLHVMSSRVRDGFTRIRFPGERAFQSLRECAEQGVLVEESMVKSLNELAERHGIAPLSGE